MQTKLLIIALIISFLGLQPCRAFDTEERIILKAVVLKIGSKPKVRSTRKLVYQLVKYRVKIVCKGEYKEKEIVVDHVIFLGDELKGIEVGDKVCLNLEVSESMSTKNVSKGIRTSSESIKKFYIGENALKITNSTVDCDCNN